MDDFVQAFEPLLTQSFFITKSSRLKPVKNSVNFRLVGNFYHI